MKIVGFIGAFYKIDMILYVAKMLSITNKRVLIIDATTEQKSRYIVPTINPTKSYITTFQDIDIAIGFNDYDEIVKYLGKKELEYDFILLDIDNHELFQNYGMVNAYKNYFVTSFDLYSIRKGLKILEQLNSPLNLTKIIFSRDILDEENQYLDYLSLGYKVSWNNYRIYFPLERGDQTAIIDNQRLSRISFKNLTSQYKEGLMYIAEELLGQSEVSNLTRALRNFEKGDL